jgi:acetyl esterase/lipase
MTMNTAASENADFKNDVRLSRGTRAFLKELNSPAPPQLEKLPPLEARKVLEQAQAAADVDYSGIDESEKTIDADGFRIVLNVVRPRGAGDKLPAFMFIHGGGWVLGDYPTHRRLVRDLVVETGYCAVFVNYTRTPDGAFPRQIDEIYAATKWVAEHGDEINVDGKNLAVVGNSVGGNMTAVTAIKAKENGGPTLKAQILMWPIVDADFDTESYRRFGRDRYLSKPLMMWMYDMYIGDPAQRTDIHASPLRASTEQLRGLPPALIQVAENDILRDEGEAYGRKLDEAGVEATTVRYDGMIHDFGMLNALANEPATRSHIRHAGAELRRRLG